MTRLRLVGNGEHRIGLRLDHRDGDLLSLLIEDLGHAQLFTDDTDHCLLIPLRSH